jgi:protein TonB
VNTIEPLLSEKPAVAVGPRLPNRGLMSRYSGTVVSLALHGGLALLGIWSVTGTGSGRGGGTVGSPEGGSGEPVYSALVQREEPLDGELRSVDARAFPEAPSEEPEPSEAVPIPPQDFLREPAETGLPVPKVPGPTEVSDRARSKEAHSKLPPENSGGGEKGDSTLNGSGGDTGGAGDGTAGALFMPAPDYPASARRKGVEGIVVVAVEVHPDGHCENARLAESSGSDALDDAALSAIRKWKYEPRPDGAAELRRVRFVFKLTK